MLVVQERSMWLEQIKVLKRIVKYTNVGCEVFSLLFDNSVNTKLNEYLEDLVKDIENKGFKVEKRQNYSTSN